MKVVANISVDEIDNTNDEIIMFRRHPVYRNYAGSRCSKFINVHKKNIMTGHYDDRHGYLLCSFRVNGKVKSYSVHRFILECYHRVIPEEMTIDYAIYSR